MKIYDKIEMKEIEAIKPYFNNPRNNERAIQALVKIIPKIGFNVPIFIDKHNVIVKGHSRYHAAKSLGMTQIPCIVSENSDAQNNADRVYDNAVNELSQWDYQKLAIELRDIDFKISDITFDNNTLQLYGGEWNPIDSVTNEDMAKAVNILDNDANRKGDNLITINCPGCGKEIMISIEDVKRIEEMAIKDAGVKQ